MDWLDTVGDLSRCIETDTMVGAVDLFSHIRLPLLWSLEGVLAACAQLWLEVGIQSHVGRHATTVITVQ